jgi:hypothetical protein
MRLRNSELHNDAPKRETTHYAAIVETAWSRVFHPKL